MYMYMVLNVSLSPKWETMIFKWTSSPLKCALGRLEAKAVGQGCACSKNVLKMTSSSVTACVFVILFLLFENLAYFFALRFNVISVCHKTKCGIDEDIPKHQLAFNYFADKNSTVNKKESKIKKLTEITIQLIFPKESWHLCIPAVHPCCVWRGDIFDQVAFVTKGNGLTRYIKLNWKVGQWQLSRFSFRCFSKWINL